MMMAGSLQVVELLRVFGVADVGEPREAERVGVVIVQDVLMRLFVVTFRVQPKDLGHVDRQRAVHIDRHGRDGAWPRTIRVDDTQGPACGPRQRPG